jgi:hypothetical protein
MATANAVQGYYKTVVTWTIAGDMIRKISCTIDIHDIQCMQTFTANVCKHFTDIMNSLELL